MKDLSVLGIDLAKNYLQLHGEDNQGKVVLKKRIARNQVLAFTANIPRCLVGIEAYGSAHYWGRELTKQGFEVKLMSPRKVKKFVENNKNDASDAQACAEAVSRKSMLFVPIKNETQLTLQGLHRIRSFYVKQQTGLMNMVRGLLYEQGIIVAQGQSALRKRLKELLEEEVMSVNPLLRGWLRQLADNLKEVWKIIAEYTKQLKAMAKEKSDCQRLETIEGIGPLTATALVAKIGNGSAFRKGRELSAYLGLVPRQQSSGDSHRLVGISKHGDRYVRQLLIHGGRSVAQAALKKDKKTGLFAKYDAHSQWIRKLIERRGMNKASVAIANKNARVALALLKNAGRFDAQRAHASVAC